jgi:hypothetical protein
VGALKALLPPLQMPIGLLNRKLRKPKKTLVIIASFLVVLRSK